jgi:hypothetical protein
MLERFVAAQQGNVKPTVEAVAKRPPAAFVHRPREATLETVYSALEAS